ncbi:MAG: FixH family protein [Bacteroidetes bacterium]|nr:FixH family protein [Bacteroidota bacterium]MBS1539665.1 FixH family protein [Bacteroidota bacterium]
MHFGKWIVVSFVFFGLFIGALITFCFRKDVNLVSKNYYDEELAYQQQIERKQNLLSLAQKPVITYNEQSGLQITFPENTLPDKGKVDLFCPSDDTRDQHFQLQPLRVQSLRISTKKGMYRVKLWWTAAGKDYYFEDQITI